MHKKIRFESGFLALDISSANPENVRNNTGIFVAGQMHTAAQNRLLMFPAAKLFKETIISGDGFLTSHTYITVMVVWPLISRDEEPTMISYLPWGMTHLCLLSS